MAATENPHQNRPLNSILRDCPMLREKVEIVSFRVGHEICGPNQPLKHMYFPTQGVLSTLVEPREGGSAESQTVSSDTQPPGSGVRSRCIGARETQLQLLRTRRNGPREGL
jgi:hypothetical protein